MTTVSTGAYDFEGNSYYAYIAQFFRATITDSKPPVKKSEIAGKSEYSTFVDDLIANENAVDFAWRGYSTKKIAEKFDELYSSLYK